MTSSPAISGEVSAFARGSRALLLTGLCAAVVVFLGGALYAVAHQNRPLAALLATVGTLLTVWVWARVRRIAERVRVTATHVSARTFGGGEIAVPLASIVAVEEQQRPYWLGARRVTTVRTGAGPGIILTDRLEHYDAAVQAITAGVAASRSAPNQRDLAGGTDAMARNQRAQGGPRARRATWSSLLFLLGLLVAITAFAALVFPRMF